MHPRFGWAIAACALLSAAPAMWGQQPAAPAKSPYDRLVGIYPLAAVVEDSIDRASPEPGGGPAGQPMLGEPAPAFRLPVLRGGMLALEELRGKFVVLHFGASW